MCFCKCRGLSRLCCNITICVKLARFISLFLAVMFCRLRFQSRKRKKIRLVNTQGKKRPLELQIKTNIYSFSLVEIGNKALPNSARIGNMTSFSINYSFKGCLSAYKLFFVKEKCRKFVNWMVRHSSLMNFDTCWCRVNPLTTGQSILDAFRVGSADDQVKSPFPNDDKNATIHQMTTCLLA